MGHGGGVFWIPRPSRACHLSYFEADVSPGAHVLEPGSGAGEKIRLLLNALEQPQSITLIDICSSSGRGLHAAAPHDDDCERVG